MFKVVDNEFNRAWYPTLIGQVYDNPPSYAIVERIKPVDLVEHNKPIPQEAQ
jgi:hypothetical protein